MAIEVEQKFRVLDVEGIKRRLSRMDDRPSETEFHCDSYFAHPARDFARTDEALRLRRIGDSNYITYKGPKLDPTTKTRREIEVELSPGDETAEHISALLAALGFSRVADVRKTREHFKVDWQGCEVTAALDEVTGVGSFAELEILTDDSHIDEARRCIGSLAGELGLTNNERRSYLELLLSKS